MSLPRSRRAPLRAAWLSAAFAAGLALTARASDAAAQARFGVRAELGAGAMLTDWQRQSLLFDSVGLQATGRLFVAPIDWLAIQASVSNWVFLSPNSADPPGHVLGVMGGLRAEPMLGRVGRLFVDANAGVAFTGPLTRFHFDAGVGFEFQLHRWIALGPAIRYGHVLQPDDEQAPSDAQWLAGGVSITFGTARAEPVAPRVIADTDSDGVDDDHDRCPSQAQGPTPDPSMPGCADGDADNDGVRNGVDQCREQPQGENADPARAGCPRADADGDGVFDSDDQCREQAQGAHPNPARVGCPDGDADSDGVLDAQDQCREQPHGAQPDPARAGCPLPDRDRDTVGDASDHCPDQAGAPHPDPERNGCPGQLHVTQGAIQIDTPVFFANNRDTILPRSFSILQAIGDALRASPHVRRVSIEGHTDDIGDDARNMDLSNRRAQSVARWLVDHGVAADRLEARGFGETRPVEAIAPSMARRALRAAQARNRRVEFRIVDPAPATSER